MLRTTKNMKEKYEKIQNLIFSLIPEKWEKMYLYASVIGGMDSKQKGEMFFYYLPKGILKKKYINVYEVPHRFNINEDQYLEVVEQLYTCIKELKQDFIDTEQELWSSITISILNFKFKIEFNYGSLPITEQENYEKRVIWRYKYLKIGGEKKEERQILDNYFAHRKKVKREIYEMGIYEKTDKNTVGFDKESTFKEPKEVIVYEKEDNSNIENDPKNILYSEKGTADEDENIELKEDKKNKNQILNL